MAGTTHSRGRLTVPVWAAPLWVAAILNVVAAGSVHALAGYLAHRVPVDRLGTDGPLLRIRPWERGGTVYRRVLRVHRWKDALPEAGAVFEGGVSKRRLAAPTVSGLEAFAIETRRAERSHWWAMSIGPLALLWNPPVGAVAMFAYGILVNLPFIVIQRYNRARIERALRRRPA